MEDETYDVRPFMARTRTNDYVLNMEPEPTLSRFNSMDNKQQREGPTEVDVCYPYEPQLLDQHPTIEVDVLNAYTKKDEEAVDPDTGSEHQMTARLNDLLENSEKPSIPRRYSRYGEIVKVSIYFLKPKI